MAVRKSNQKLPRSLASDLAGIEDMRAALEEFVNEGREQLENSTDAYRETDIASECEAWFSELDAVVEALQAAVEAYEAVSTAPSEMA